MVEKLSTTSRDAQSLRIGPGDALLLVDVQNDFLPGGSLAVPNGDAVIAPLNQYIDLFLRHGLPIIATRDWHPADHCSFQAQGGPWPPHCVAATRGAAFATELNLPCQTLIISKGTSADREAYSGFAGTDLHEKLRELGVRRLLVGGLATDYCVRRTVEDALERGYRVGLLLDAIQAVNVKPGDGDQAIAAMVAQGAMPLTLAEVAA